MNKQERLKLIKKLCENKQENEFVDYLNEKDYRGVYYNTENYSIDDIELNVTVREKY